MQEQQVVCLSNNNPIKNIAMVTQRKCIQYSFT